MVQEVNMPRRLAATASLIVFAICLLTGIQAENSIGTSIQRGLVAMFGTLIVGLVVGTMAQKMLDENVQAQEEKVKNNSTQNGASDR
jgi:hypothetical protein